MHQDLTVYAVKYRLIPGARIPKSSRLRVTAFGRDFPHPLGTGCGFDKDLEAVDGFFRVGFSFVEVGSVTPEKQFGNPRPRVFRLKADKAMVDHYGFYSCGREKAMKNLLESSIMRQRALEVRRDMFDKHGGIFRWLPTSFYDKGSNQSAWDRFVGISLGKMRGTEDAASDYCIGISYFGDLADFVSINISSPNMPGLRDLQKKDSLPSLLRRAKEQCSVLKHKPMLFVKISPDLTDDEVEDVCRIITSEECKVDGVIISNSTSSRPSYLKDRNQCYRGALSGAPTKPLSTALIRKVYKITQGTLPIIGVGGIFSGEDAFEKIAAGACLIQTHTAFAYEGPPVIGRIVRELDAVLEEKGFQSVTEAIGSEFR